MMPIRSLSITVSALVILATPLVAQQPERRSGPVIRSGGEVFVIRDPEFATPVDLTYRVAFDIAVAAEQPDQVNASLNSVARFLNMHAQAGVPRDRLQLAVVVHGTAGKDLLDDAAYRERLGVENPNRALLRELMGAGVQIILCGQTAASRGLPRDGLIEGVRTALSAMTAHAVLQEHGYRLNPF